MNIILLGGATGAGKEQISKLVQAKIANISGQSPEIITTHNVHWRLANLPQYEQNGLMQAEPFDAAKFSTGKTDEEKVINGFLMQSDITVQQGLVNDLDKKIKNNENVIVQGIQLVPEIIQKAIIEPNKNSKINIIPAIVSIQNYEEYLSRLLKMEGLIWNDKCFGNLVIIQNFLKKQANLFNWLQYEDKGNRLDENNFIDILVKSVINR